MNMGTIPLSKPRKGSTQASPVYLLISLNPDVPESYPGSCTTFSFFSLVSWNLSSSSAFPCLSWHWHLRKITGQLCCQTSLSFGLMFSHNWSEVRHFLQEHHTCDVTCMTSQSSYGQVFCMSDTDLDQWWCWPHCQVSPMQRYVFACAVSQGGRWLFKKERVAVIMHYACQPSLLMAAAARQMRGI